MEARKPHGNCARIYQAKAGGLPRVALEALAHGFKARMIQVTILERSGLRRIEARGRSRSARAWVGLSRPARELSLTDRGTRVTESRVIGRVPVWGVPARDCALGCGRGRSRAMALFGQVCLEPLAPVLTHKTFRVVFNPSGVALLGTAPATPNALVAPLRTTEAGAAVELSVLLEVANAATLTRSTMVMRSPAKAHGCWVCDAGTHRRL